MSTLQAQLKATPAILKRHRTMLSIVAGVIVIYAVVGFFWLPRFARGAAIEYVAKNLHRQLTIGAIRFNPFTFTARINAVKLSEANGQPIASVNELLVNAELSSLWHRAYTFKQVRITAPMINTVVNSDGSINLAQIKPDATEPATTESSGLPAVRIGSFELDRGEVRFEDRSRPTPFATTLKPIKFTLKNFRTKPNYDNAFRFDATSAAGEYFDWQGEFTVRPLAANGHLLVRNLKASTIQAYLQSTLSFRLLTGQISLQGDYQVSMNDTPDVKLKLTSIEMKDTRIAPAGDIAINAAASSSSSSSVATDDAWINLPSLNVDDLQLSLQQRSVNIRRVRGDGAEFKTWLDEQRQLNLLSLSGPPSSSDAPKWSIAIADILFSDATIHTEDRGVKPTAKFTLQPVQLQIKDYSTAPGSVIQLDTRIGIVSSAEPNAQFTAQGSVQLDTSVTQLQINLTQFELAALQSYFAQTTDLLVNGGRVNASGTLRYGGSNPKPNAPASIKFDGQAEVRDLATQDTVEHNDFLKWRQVNFKDINFSLAPDQLVIAQITAREPYSRVIINPDATTNIQQILRLKKADADADTDVDAASNKDTHQAGKTDQKDQSKKPSNAAARQADAPAMKVRVTKILIENGSVNFADNSVKPGFASGIQKLMGTISNVSSANDSRAKVNLKGQVDNYAPVSIAGEANFLAAETYSDLAMNFSNIDLTIFNPYSGKFAGYSIAKGKLSTEMRYEIRDRQLDLQHHIVVDQLEFGEATESKDKVPLPIKLAVALLKDRNGVIDLNLPVSGSLDDPKFRLGPIIWKAFVGLLDRIVTSPFRALGALFGGGEELSYVDFQPGSAELDATQRDKLDQLGKALIERPQLRLEIPANVATDVDADVLNKAALERALLAYLPKSGNATPAQRLAALTALYKKQLNAEPKFGTPPNAQTDMTAERITALEHELLPHFAISAADRDQLTRQRAIAVQTLLLANTELSPERVFMTARPNETQSPAGVVRMPLALE